MVAEKESVKAGLWAAAQVDKSAARRAEKKVVEWVERQGSVLALN